MQPTTLAEYGQSAAAVVLTNFLKSWVAKRPIGQALLLHGPPGCGKTTLVRCAAATFGATLTETNASSDYNKDLASTLLNAALTQGTDGLRIILLDECDNLTSAQQRNVANLITKSSCPVILAANDRYGIDKEVRQLCQEVIVGRPTPSDLQRVAKTLGVAPSLVGKARSYREAQQLVVGIEVPIGLHKTDDFRERAELWVRGENVELTSEEQNWLKTWLLDNRTDAAPATYDHWLARQRVMGASGGKYARVAARASRPSLAPWRWPWSLGVGREAKPKKAPKEPKRPKEKKAEPEPVKVPATVVKADDFF